MKTKVMLRSCLVGLAALYLALGVIAAACAVDPASMTLSHHQHGNAEQHGPHAQGSLCAWACLANLTSSIAPVIPTLTLALVVLLSVLFRSQTPSFLHLDHLRARAPPF